MNCANMRAVHAVHAVHLLCREYMEIPSASKNIIHGSLQEKHEINIVKRISKFQKTYIHFICKVILLYLANSLLQCKSTIFFEGIFRGILSVTMSVAGEYQKILTKDKGLGAGIHRDHRLR